jgi:hypothetical protein
MLNNSANDTTKAAALKAAIQSHKEYATSVSTKKMSILN